MVKNGENSVLLPVRVERPEVGTLMLWNINLTNPILKEGYHVSINDCEKTSNKQKIPASTIPWIYPYFELSIDWHNWHRSKFWFAYRFDIRWFKISLPGTFGRQETLTNVFKILRSKYWSLMRTVSLISKSFLENFPEFCTMVFWQDSWVEFPNWLYCWNGDCFPF